MFLLSKKTAVLWVVSALSIFIQAPNVKGAPSPLETANAELMDSEGRVQGNATITETQEGVLVRISIQGLKPGQYGIHFHEKGICEIPDFTSAGGHFNPYKKEHGLKNDKGSHAGDLPNLVIKKLGLVKKELKSSQVTLQADMPNSLLQSGGTAIIIHERRDEQNQNVDPSGNSGKRIYCGVIKKSKVTTPMVPVANY